MNRAQDIVRNILSPSTWKRRVVFFCFDVISFAAALVLAFWIRFDFRIPNDLMRNWGVYLPIFLGVKVFLFVQFRLYDISWSHFSLRDLTTLVKASLIAELMLVGIVYASGFGLFKGFPRSVLVVDFIVGILLCSALRISKRITLEILHTNYTKGHLCRTLVVGAGNSGDQLMRDLYRRQPTQFFPIGFVDDDPVKRGLYIQGIPVLGSTEQLPQVVARHGIKSIIIAVPTADRSFHRRILSLARASGVQDVKIVSTINDLSNLIRVGIKDLREIDITDLIGRQAVSIDASQIRSFLKNKRVLVTGASGSIGSEIARQVCFYEPTSVALLDINESDLVALVEGLRANNNLPIGMCLGDVSDPQRMENIVSTFQPEVIFHAAAYKHVPVMEQFPEEAIRVNILGTYNMALFAARYKVRHFVLISTDKAVNPTSIMGASKRIAEYIVTAMGSVDASTFVAVRFGNVIGSRGSVLPIFVEQIRRGGPVTITHPEMKRYFMTLQESVALVVQAAAVGRHGDVFVLDMGEPLRIVDLARELITLNNLVPDKDIKIEFIGIRDGEKLYEELLTAEEGVDATTHNKIFRARIFVRHSRETIDMMIDQLRGMNGKVTKRDIVGFFRQYLPSFRPEQIVNRTNEENDLSISPIGDTEQRTDVA